MACAAAPPVSERERLILAHLPQVRLIARRIHERLPVSVALEDLVSVGVIGLISAIDHFDPAQNVRLRTYAEYKIRGAILDSLRSLDWAPRDVRKRAKQIQAAVHVAAQRLGQEPPGEEVAAELGIPLEQYHKQVAEVHSIDFDELDYAPPGQSGATLLHYLAGNEENHPSRIAERAELEALVIGAVQKMPPAERTVLNLYYLEELSLREIAQVMRLNISRICQLKAQAILRLRRYVSRPRGEQASRT